MKYALKQLDPITTSFFLISGIIALVGAPLYLYYNDLAPGFWIFAVVLMVITSLSITGGYHRLFSHRTYDANPLFKILYLLFGAGAIQNSALIWCTEHRRHHRFVDTDQDPYSINKGFFFAHIGWILLKEDPRFAGQYEEDLKKDKLVLLQHKYYFPIAIAVSFLFPMAVGAYFGHMWGGLIIGGFLRVFITSHCTFLINSAAHFWGTQPYTDKNTAKDNFLLAFFTYGEGYHNFHHKFQSDYRNGIKWYDWDPTKWIIYGMSKLGFASRLKTISPAMILEAKIQMDQKRLSDLGIPEERFANLWKKVDEAKKNWHHLQQEYAAFKMNMSENSKQRLHKLQFELKLAKLQFRHSCKQWAYFVKRCRARPSLGL
jgi:stearoyl-CoA desaturase (delta-9 desaturase)